MDDLEAITTQKVGFYYGIEEDTKLDLGIYNYTNTLLDEIITKYVLINQNGIETLGVDTLDNLINSIQNVVLFGEDNKVCHEKTVSIIEEMITKFFKLSCLESYKKDLPN